jgi:hypothetical protein
MARLGFRFGSQHHPAVVEEVIDSSQLLKELCRVFSRCAENTLIAYRNQPNEDLPHRNVLIGCYEFFHNVGTVKGVLTSLKVQVPEHRPDPNVLEELRTIGDDHWRLLLPVVANHHTLCCRRKSDRLPGQRVLGLSSVQVRFSRVASAWIVAEEPVYLAV